MDFPLTDEILNQIIFAMENQQHKYLVNRATGELIPAEDFNSQETERLYVPIPEWRPIDGFNLMESFLSKLRNPIFRELLNEALSTGKGVFRNFKNTLKKNKEVERLWFSFKEREMKQIVVRWYNEQRELVGLERIGPEPEETEELLLSDFVIRQGESKHLEPLVKLDRKAFAELFPEASPERVEGFYYKKRKNEPNLLDSKSLLLVVETPGNDFAGFIWGVEKEDPLSGKLILKLMQLAVVKHYRGLGLAHMLIRRLIDQAYDRGYEKMSVELTGSSLSFEKIFHSLGLNTVSQTLELDLGLWERNNT